jgi:hypothetical protein
MTMQLRSARRVATAAVPVTSVAGMAVTSVAKDRR